MSGKKDTRPPCERVNDVERILFEMSQAVREALARHKKLGESVVVYRDGRVQWIAAEDIPIEAVTLLPEWDEQTH